MQSPCPKTILLADDDDDILAALSQRCAQLGLKVVVARTGFEAIMAIRTNLPDVACLDVNMPAGDGLSLCQMLMADQDSMHLPIIILTGRKEAAVVRRCQELRAIYVTKGASVWRDIEPVLRDVLNLPASPLTSAACAPVFASGVLPTAELPQPESD